MTEELLAKLSRMGPTEILRFKEAFSEKNAKLLSAVDPRQDQGTRDWYLSQCSAVEKAEAPQLLAFYHQIDEILQRINAVRMKQTLAKFDEATHDFECFIRDFAPHLRAVEKLNAMPPNDGLGGALGGLISRGLAAVDSAAGSIDGIARGQPAEASAAAAEDAPSATPSLARDAAPAQASASPLEVDLLDKVAAMSPAEILQFKQSFAEKNAKLLSAVDPRQDQGTHDWYLSQCSATEKAEAPKLLAFYHQIDEILQRINAIRLKQTLAKFEEATRDFEKFIQEFAPNLQAVETLNAMPPSSGLTGALGGLISRGLSAFEALTPTLGGTDDGDGADKKRAPVDPAKIRAAELDTATQQALLALDPGLAGSFRDSFSMRNMKQIGAHRPDISQEARDHWKAECSGEEAASLEIYRFWEAIDGLLTMITPIREALASGDVATATARYRTFLGAFAPVAAAVDERQALPASGPADAAYGAFFRSSAQALKTLDAASIDDRDAKTINPTPIDTGGEKTIDPAPIDTGGAKTSDPTPIDTGGEKTVDPAPIDGGGEKASDPTPIDGGGAKAVDPGLTDDEKTAAERAEKLRKAIRAASRSLFMPTGKSGFPIGRGWRQKPPAYLVRPYFEQAGKTYPSGAALPMGVTWHWTAGASMESARNALHHTSPPQPPKKSVSAHYCIGRDLDEGVERYVSLENRSWHAGIDQVMRWDGKEMSWRKEGDSKGSRATIGIEIVSLGLPGGRHYPEERLVSVAHPKGSVERVIRFTDEQYEMMIVVAREIVERWPHIRPWHHHGHYDICPDRKIDPMGLDFARVLRAAYDDETIPDVWTPLTHAAQRQRVLVALGYRVAVDGDWGAMSRAALRQFQEAMEAKKKAVRPGLIGGMLAKLAPPKVETLPAPLYSAANGYWSTFTNWDAHTALRERGLDLATVAGPPGT